MEMVRKCVFRTSLDRLGSMLVYLGGMEGAVRQFEGHFGGRGFSNGAHGVSPVIMYETGLGLAVARGYVVFSRVRR